MEKMGGSIDFASVSPKFFNLWIQLSLPKFARFKSWFCFFFFVNTVLIFHTVLLGKIKPFFFFFF